MGRTKDVESFLLMVKIVQLDSGDVEYSKEDEIFDRKRRHFVKIIPLDGHHAPGTELDRMCTEALLAVKYCT